MTHLVHVLLPAFLVSFLLVGLVRRYALRSELVDRPNDRSSHVVPTPRGGGLGVIGAIVLAWGALGGWRDPLESVAMAGVMLVGAVGWMDDHRNVSPGSRLRWHLIGAAAIAPLAWATGSGGVVGGLLVAWWIFLAVSAINLTNFMDGIDALIGSQMALFSLHVLLLWEGAGGTHALAWSLAGATVGFLLWNRPPARVFLGDVGSGALGILAVILGALLARDGVTDQFRLFLPLFPIALDASLTILRRLRRGEDVFSPHRSHFYQRLANDHDWGHARVTLLYLFASSLGLLVVHFGGGTPGWVLGAGYVGALLAGGAVIRRRAPAFAGVNSSTAREANP